MVAGKALPSLRAGSDGSVPFSQSFGNRASAPRFTPATLVLPPLPPPLPAWTPGVRTLCLQHKLESLCVTAYVFVGAHLSVLLCMPQWDYSPGHPFCWHKQCSKETMFLLLPTHATHELYVWLEVATQAADANTLPL